MNITETAAAIGISALIAMGGSAPATNSSETGATHTPRETPVEREVTRTPRDTKSDIITMRGESEHFYLNYQTYDMLAVMRMDADNASTARMVVSMMDSPYILGELDGFHMTGTFNVRNAGTCSGLEGTMSGMPVYLVACADGRWVTLVLATDRSLAVGIVQDVYRDGAFTVPAGFVEDDLS